MLLSVNSQLLVPEGDRTELARIAGTNSEQALRARIVLERAHAPSDRATAQALGVDARTVARWRRCYAERGLSGLTHQANPTPADAAGKHESALLTPLVNVPGDGAAWTSRTVAARVGLSQSTVSRVWREAAFVPPPAGTLVADPWFCGRARCLAGIYAVPSQGGGGEWYRAVAFYVDQRPPLSRHRAREAALVASESDRRDMVDDALTVCTAFDQRPADAATARERSVSWRGFVAELVAHRPEGTHVWIMANQPLSPTDAAWAGERPVEQRTLPTTRAWVALALRSLAATGLVHTARGLPNPLPRAATQVQAQQHTPGPEVCWIAPIGSAHAAIETLRQRRPRRPRRAVSQPPVPELSRAMHRLRTRRLGHADTDQPMYELLTQLRARAVDERVDATDCADALAVLADLHTTRDAMEHALIGYCREMWAPPWDIATRVGVSTLHAVGQRYRRLAKPHRPRATHAPRPQAVAPLDEQGRPRNLTRKLLTELHQRWVGDLVDDEARIEALPGTEDLFGSLVHILHRDRPVLHSADPEGLSPIQRRQADGLAGLALVDELHRQLQWERLCWYRLAEQTGLTLARTGAPFGRTPSAVIKDRHRLAHRFTEPDTPEAHPARRRYWDGRAEAIHDILTALYQYREDFADDEEILFWIEELDHTIEQTGRASNGLFHGFVTELAEPRPCDSCTTPRAPVIQNDRGDAQCATCAGRHHLADLVDQASALAVE